MMNNRRGEEEDANFSPSQLLQLAQTHLRLRNFSLCRQYALESQQPNDPNSLSNHRQASQILAISNILSSPTNYYSILQVDTFSNDFTLIRSNFKHLLSILNPIKNNSQMANEAVNLVWKAYGCLFDSAKKAHFDSQISGQNCGLVEGEEVGTFWTFCPYCFYMYQYSRVYEGCCLRCQNQTCRRAFQGVVVNSIPNADLEKGNYFSCFGYFPLGFSPEQDVGKKFESWSPIVGMFPVKRIGNTRAGRLDLNDDYNNNNVDFDVDPNFIEILDESDDQGENFGTNVGGANAGKVRPMKRKSVAWNARKLMGEGGMNDNEGVANVSEDYGDADEDEDEDVGEGHVFDGDQDGVGVDSGFENEDMAFFEEGGEIFVEFGPDGVL